MVFNRIICQAFTCGSDRLLQLLSRPKGNLLAGCDLHRLSRGRIAPYARLTLANLDCDAGAIMYQEVDPRASLRSFDIRPEPGAINSQEGSELKLRNDAAFAIIVFDHFLFDLIREHFDGCVFDQVADFIGKRSSGKTKAVDHGIILSSAKSN